MFSGCPSPAIQSHVLQKNGILREISENNHLIENKPSNPFLITTQGLSEFKLVGINEVYTFPGFCPKHDSSLFMKIESNPNLNLLDYEQQILFGYRGLCQELRRKEIGTEMLIDLRASFPAAMTQTVDDTIDGFKDAIKNLSFFKEEFEICFGSDQYFPFHFETIKIPRIDVCISAPLNIGDLEIPEDGDYERWKANKSIPFITSFINLFPLNESSIFIAGFHKSYPCDWTQQLINKIKVSNKSVTTKLISDLITLRLEFWTMSPKLFKSISVEKIKAYKTTFSDNVLNHSPGLTTELNLFE